MVNHNIGQAIDVIHHEHPDKNTYKSTYKSIVCASFLAKVELDAVAEEIEWFDKFGKEHWFVINNIYLL